MGGRFESRVAISESPPPGVGGTLERQAIDAWRFCFSGLDASAIAQLLLESWIRPMKSYSSG